MKKLLALILAAFMMITMFTACGGGDEEHEKKEEKETVDPDVVEDLKAEVKELEEKVNELENKEETVEISDEDKPEIENAVGNFVEAAILKKTTGSGDDKKYKVFDHIGNELEVKYTKAGSPFTGEPKTLTDTLEEKIDAWVEENGVKDEAAEKKIVDFIKAKLSKLIKKDKYYECEIDALNAVDGKEDVIEASVTIKRYDLSKLDKILNAVLALGEDFESITDDNEKISAIEGKIKEVLTERIEETSVLTLEKDEDKWLVTDDGSLGGE